MPPHPSTFTQPHLPSESIGLSQALTVWTECQKVPVSQGERSHTNAEKLPNSGSLEDSSPSDIELAAQIKNGGIKKRGTGFIWFLSQYVIKDSMKEWWTNLVVTWPFDLFWTPWVDFHPILYTLVRYAVTINHQIITHVDLCFSWLFQEVLNAVRPLRHWSDFLPISNLLSRLCLCLYSHNLGQSGHKPLSISQLSGSQSSCAPCYPCPGPDADEPGPNGLGKTARLLSAQQKALYDDKEVVVVNQLLCPLHKALIHPQSPWQCGRPLAVLQGGELAADGGNPTWITHHHAAEMQGNSGWHLPIRANSDRWFLEPEAADMLL